MLLQQLLAALFTFLQSASDALITLITTILGLLV